MTKEERIKNMMDGFIRLADAYQESQQIGANNADRESDVYWRAIYFSKEYFEKAI